MKNYAFRLVGVALALVVLILIAWKPSDEPVYVETRANSPRADEARRVDIDDSNRDMFERREITDSNPEDPLALRMIARGDLVGQDGGLWYQDENGASLELRVENGKAEVERKGREFWLGLEQEAWFVPDSGFSSLVHRVEESESGLDCILGDTVELSLLVTDREGKPIDGAYVSVGGAFASRPESIRTSSDGKWNGQVIGDLPIRVTCTALGYGEASITFDELHELGSIEQTLVLGRILAVGLIVDRRHRQSIGFTGSSSFRFTMRDENSSSLKASIEANSGLDEFHEGVKWHIVVESTSQDPVDQEVLVQLSVEGGRTYDVTAGLRHILDPEFELIRMAEQFEPGLLVPVDVQLLDGGGGPLQGAPPVVLLHWEGNDDLLRGGIELGRKVPDSTGTYRFFLPEGIYSVGPVKEGLSLGESEVAPGIESVSDIRVEGGVLPPLLVEAQLEAGCFLASYLIVDSTGVPYSNSWVLCDEEIVASMNGGAFLGPGASPKSAFFNVDRKYEILSSPMNFVALIPTGILHDFQGVLPEAKTLRIVLPRGDVPTLGN